MKSEHALEAALRAVTRDHSRIQKDLDEIDSRISAVRAMLGGRSAAKPRKKAKRVLSEAGRKSISDAQKKRWAAKKKAAKKKR